MKLDKKFKQSDYNYDYDVIGEETKRVFFNFLKFFDFNKIFFFKYDQPKDFLNLNKIVIQYLTSTVFVNFEHVIQFSDELSDVIQEQYVRIEPYLRISFNEFFKNYLQKNINRKELWISFYNIPNKKKFKMVDTRLLNKLISISGVITRITDYFPKLLLGTFQCSNFNCNFKMWHVEENYIYMEPKICKICGNVNWILNTKQSAFIFLQELKIQEINKYVLYEQIPFSINVYIKYNQIDTLKLGKVFIFSGYLIVLPINDLFVNTYLQNFNLQYINFQNYNLSKKINENIACKFYFWTSHLLPYKQYTFREIFEIEKYTSLKINLDKYFISLEEKKKILKIRNNKFLLTNYLNNFYLNASISQELKTAILFMFIGRKKQDNTKEIMTQNGINICAIENIEFKKFSFIKKLVKFFPGIVYINLNTFSKIKSTTSDSNCIEFNPSFIHLASSLFSDKSINIIDNYISLTEYHHSALECTESYNILKFKTTRQINLKTNKSVLTFINPENHMPSLLFDYNFDLCFNLTDTHSKLVGYLEFINGKFITYRKFKRLIYKEKSYLKNFHFYQYYIRFLIPNFSKKSYTFMVKLYRFMREQLIIANIFFNKITIKHFETLVKLSEAISKFYISLYVEKFQIKAGIRLLIFSIYSYNYSNYISFKKNKNSNKYSFSSKLDQENRSKMSKNFAMFKITSNEFEFIYKNLISELKKFEEIGIIGLPLRKLLLNLMGLFNHKLSKRKIVNKLTLIVLIIKKFLKKENTLILIKHYPRRLNHFYINIICLNRNK
jgi:DNA replication licensing factor MCM6